MIKPPPTPKGFRDIAPEQAKRRRETIAQIEDILKSFGFVPIETPTIEFAETLTGKYGGEEKLIYQFEDQGGRKLALRYDLTVPLARYVATYNPPWPFRRYQIGQVFRGENPQKGRFREFTQFDFDSVGSPNVAEDAKIIAAALKSLEKLGLTGYSMRVNDRRIFDSFNLSAQALRELDKIDKKPLAFIKQLLLEGKNNLEADQLFNAIANAQKPQSVKELFSLLKDSGFEEGRNNQYWFDPSLARGLDYYTGLIFELRIEKYGSLSVGGGGRYDNLIGMFANRDIPAVGFAFGFDRLMEAMEELNLFPTNLQTTKVLVTVFSPELKGKAIAMSSQLRLSNINTEIYLDENASLEKQLKYADRKGIPYVIIIGPEETQQNVVKVRNMVTRQEQTIPQGDELLQILKSW